MPSLSPSRASRGGRERSPYRARVRDRGTLHHSLLIRAAPLPRRDRPEPRTTPPHHQVMLSGETAGGKFPNEAVEHMAACCVEAEAIVPCDALAAALRGATLATFGMSGAESVACSAVRTAADVGAKMIISLAATGRTTQLIAKVSGVCVCVVFGVVVVVTSSRCVWCSTSWLSSSLLSSSRQGVRCLMFSLSSSSSRRPLRARASRVSRAHQDDRSARNPTMKLHSTPLGRHG